MEPHEVASKVSEMEKGIESLVAMVSELYEKTHRVERVLIDEGTVQVQTPEIDEHGPEGLYEESKAFAQDSGRCSVTSTKTLQNHLPASFFTIRRAQGLHLVPTHHQFI